MFIVRGVNVYPSAVVAVVGEFHPHVSGRARVVLPTGAVTVDPPVEVHVELAAASVPGDLAARIADAIRQRLTFHAGRARRAGRLRRCRLQDEPGRAPLIRTWCCRWPMSRG